MVEGKKSRKSGYLPKKLPTNLSLFRRTSNTEEGMSRQQANFRILFASILVLVSTIIVSINIISATEFIIYAYILLLANFAGYAFILNHSLGTQKPLPTKVINVIALLISTGFTAAISAVMNSIIPLREPRNLLIYILMFVLITLPLLPEKAANKINKTGKIVS